MQNYDLTCFNTAFVDTTNIENKEEKSPSLDHKTTNNNNSINENNLSNIKPDKSSIRIQIAKKRTQLNYLSPHSQKIESPEQLFELVQSPKSKVQEYSQLKQTLRTTNWSIDHPIRRSLWKSIVQLNQNQSHKNDQHKQINMSDKENNKDDCLSSFDFDIAEYNRQLNLIFGKGKFCIEFIYWIAFNTWNIV